jgi:hypothetical protein
MADDDDPTRMRNQASLTTSSGTVWLVIGGLAAVITVVLLWSLQQVNSSGIAIAGIVAILLLYVAMVEVRLLVRILRLRLILLAIGFGLLTAVALVCVAIIGASAAAP